MKRSTIRGVRIVREEYVPPDRVPENLKYEIDVYDERDNWLECLGRLHDLDPAIAAFSACCAKCRGRGGADDAARVLHDIRGAEA